MVVFERLKQSLKKTRQGLVNKIEGLITRRRIINQEFYDELEEILIQSDVGVDATLELIDKLRLLVKEKKINDSASLKPLLQEIIQGILGEEIAPLKINREGFPTVIMVVGVNGTGKTTTIGKLAYYFKKQGQRVLLAAADTFRAAAIEQLEMWGSRVGAEVIKHFEGADPAAVAFDGLKAACSRRADVLIVDTAGRLHTKTNLMEELKKIARILARELPGAPHEVLLVLDATTGQNAINQARIFGEAIGVTGIILAKFDGTAKGGVIIGIKQALGIPVKFIGIGEKPEDLRPFDAREFVEALFAD